MIDNEKRKVLLKVQKPGRYLGNEWGSINKSGQDIDVKFGFCFPDTYEVGMSHLGLKILYSLLNEREDVWCQRVFMPWVDMMQQMKENEIELYALESGQSIRTFDMLGFTLQYELSYSNILNMLQLANIPLYSEQRDESYPLICAGGPCAYNVEPIADFLDFVIMGEGEEVMLEIIDEYKLYKKNKQSKMELLKRLSQIDGVYVPSFYDVTYNDDGAINSVTPKVKEAKNSIKKRIIKDFDKVYTPKKTIVPNIEIVHDRVNLEIFRGCARGCRFCQAGMIYRPVREKKVDTLMELAHSLIDFSGYNEISLASLSTSDFSKLEELLNKLLEWSNKEKINFALPSQRVDKFSKELMDKIQSVRKSGITFAPEAGTQRLRDVINKNLSEEEILKACQIAFEGANTTVKLYFMSGLPSETMEDIDGIKKLAYKIIGVYNNIQNKNYKKPININISISGFVPKPFTPFQWVSQDKMEIMKEKHVYLKTTINNKKIRVSYSDEKTSFLEAVFSRGDRRLSNVLKQAVEDGCCFDGWGEHFRFDKWMNAFEKCGVNPEFYANRERTFDEKLPWDHIDVGVNKQFLIEQANLSKQEITTPNCMDLCSNCGIMDAFGGDVCG